MSIRFPVAMQSATEDSTRSDDMADSNSPVPWTEEQWVRVRQVIQEEAARARVGATFLPLYGPLPPDTDFVPGDAISYEPNDGAPAQRMMIQDTTTVQVPTLQVKVSARGAQVADPELTSALQLFRRAANVLARLEDAVVFQGLVPGAPAPAPVPAPAFALAARQLLEPQPGGTVPDAALWEIQGGQALNG